MPGMKLCAPGVPKGSPQRPQRDPRGPPGGPQGTQGDPQRDQKKKAPKRPQRGEGTNNEARSTRMNLRRDKNSIFDTCFSDAARPRHARTHAGASRPRASPQHMQKKIAAKMKTLSFITHFCQHKRPSPQPAHKKKTYAGERGG